MGCTGESIGCTQTNSNFFHDDRISVLASGVDSRVIYRTTIHEYSLVSQYSHQKKGSFSKLDTIYVETFARGIEMYFAKDRYGDPGLYFKVNGKTSISYFHNYTGLITDLIDDVTSTADLKKSNIDKVSGFNIKDIETAFFNSDSMNALKKYLKEKYPSGKNGRKYSSSDLDKLFDYWTKL